MRAHVIVHRRNKSVERAIVAAVAGCITYVIQAQGAPHYTAVALLFGVGAWLPRLAQKQHDVVGKLALRDDALHVEDGPSVPLSMVRAARAQAGRRGASLVVCLQDGVWVASCESADEAEAMAQAIRERAKVGEDIALNHPVVAPLERGLRIAVTLATAAYYLFTVAQVLPGSKGYYGVTMLVLAMVLGLVHLLPLGWRPLASGGPFDAYGPAVAAHFDAHARGAEVPEVPSLSEHTESESAWLTRLRTTLEAADPYRQDGPAFRERLEDALHGPGLPVAKRALALRVLAADDRPQLQTRIEAVPDADEEEAAWLEQIALAESDEEALRIVSETPPRFRA